MRHIFLLSVFLGLLLGGTIIRAQSPDTVAYSAGFAPLPLLHNATRIEFEGPLSFLGRSRWLAAPVFYSGLSQGYTDSRSQDLNRFISGQTSLLYRYDRMSGWGLETGIKYPVLRPFGRDENGTLYVGGTLGLHRIKRKFEDAGWVSFVQDGLTYLRPGLDTFEDQITRFDLGLWVGSRSSLGDGLFVDIYLILNRRFSSVQTSYTPARPRPHNDIDWLDHAYEGTLLRLGIVMGYQSYRPRRL
ncbi:MAG: hypothetical protein ACFCUI_13310 [Bernardetiaceae bacterium]